MIDWDKAVIGPTIKVFGEPVMYAPASGITPFPIVGVFDEAYLGLIVVDGVQVQTEQPTLGVQLSQFRANGKTLFVDVLPEQDDQLTIVRTGAVYVVREPRPDGHGHARLMLNYLGDDDG
ncbi:hypothetical protein QCE62_06910 [Caballeronia sp. LZ033]|uniref:head-tail joining protein n=1 Tax=Caballeronia sp. LZ033 TaxID=3038566 RepID=UPI00285CAB6D|nr:hypothetical protein [Caballeronia sp. LZ033]MDR5813321.1 hypothetical protein [Caballeronia sp. LZ033]